ncbi:MAG TPA: tetratricopeptide repeat protein [Oligoflexus sp.]|uniref:tetratricopeptide repeat protein n=1 Tax=Oligoflexus sp. TaxID=1971216 RepID=UPI002D7FDE18|nr:tetratricopeptide repeat protein [Oligoflexus sp.]HET9240434.1 tetratricopeptide repeat protein [Oligoflexus sp.]
MHEEAQRSRRYWKILATTLHKEGRYAEALRIYRQAILLNPDDADLCYNLGNLLRTIGQHEKAIGVYEHAYRLNPKDPDILVNLAPLYRSTQKRDKARECYGKILALDPENVTAHYFLAALDGSTPPRAPAAYVIELFDQYAATYDQHMNQVLKYKAPESLRNLLNSYGPARGRRYEACDLGCGTGRSMDAFQKLVTHVDGYDLSPVMLERAAERNIYRQLIAGDCMETLGAATESYDLFLAADLLPYIGEVDSLFTVIRQKAKSPAFLLFSTEFQESGNSPRLMISGRYQHSLAYIQSRLRTHGMHLRAFQVEPLRLQAQVPIAGGIYLVEV